MCSLVEKKIQARRNPGSALARSLSTPHAPSQYPSASANTNSTTRRSHEKPSSELISTATKPRYAGPRPMMITLPSSPSPQHSPELAHRRDSSLGSASPTANPLRLKSPQTAVSPLEEPVARTPVLDQAPESDPESDPDEQSLTSELSEMFNDPDFQRRVEERGQKRVIQHELTTREENGDELNEEEKALLSELRRAQEIETAATAAWRGVAPPEKLEIETTHWERYKERLRATEEQPLERDYNGGQDYEGGEDGVDPLTDEGSGSESGRRPRHGAFRLPLLSILCGPEIS